MSQIQGMNPEPLHRHGGQGQNPAASLLPTDGGSVGDGHTDDIPGLLEDGNWVWPQGWDEERKTEWRRRYDLALSSELGLGP